jgi:hypothetical protein
MKARHAEITTSSAVPRDDSVPVWQGFGRNRASGRTPDFMAAPCHRGTALFPAFSRGYGFQYTLTMAESGVPIEPPPPFVFSLTRRRLGIPAWIWVALFIACGVFSQMQPASPKYRFGVGGELRSSVFRIITLADGTQHYDGDATQPKDQQHSDITSEIYVHVEIRRGSGSPHPTWGRVGFCNPVMYYEAHVVSLPMGSGSKVM